METNEALADIEKDGTQIESDEQLVDILKNTDDLELSPSDSPSEDEKTEENPSQEGEQSKSDDSDNTPDEKNLPFHKHPRWQKMQDDSSSKDETITELQEAVQLLQTKQEVVDNSNQPLPPEFVALYGDDAVARKAYDLQQRQFADMETRMTENFEKTQRDNIAKQQKQDDASDQWVKDELQLLTDAGEKFDENKLMSVAKKFQPLDESGNISLSKALEILRLQEEKPDKTVQKQVAANTASTNQGDQQIVASPSTNTLRNRSMQSLAQE